MRYSASILSILILGVSLPVGAQPIQWQLVEKPHQVVMDAFWVRIKGDAFDPAEQTKALKNCSRSFLLNSHKQYAELTAIPGIELMKGNLAFIKTADGLMRVGQVSKPPYFARIKMEGVRNYQGGFQAKVSEEVGEYWNNLKNKTVFRYRFPVTDYFAIHNIQMPNGEVGVLLRDGVKELYDPRNPGLIRSYLRCGSLQADWKAAGL